MNAAADMDTRPHDAAALYCGRYFKFVRIGNRERLLVWSFGEWVTSMVVHAEVVREIRLAKIRQKDSHVR